MTSYRGFDRAVSRLKKLDSAISSRGVTPLPTLAGSQALQLLQLVPGRIVKRLTSWF